MVQVDAQYRYPLETVNGFKDGKSFWQHKLPKQRSFGRKHHVKKIAGINQAGSKVTSSICDLIAAELTWKRLPSQLREFLCLRLSWECKIIEQVHQTMNINWKRALIQLVFVSLHWFCLPFCFKMACLSSPQWPLPVASATLPQPKLRPARPAPATRRFRAHRLIVSLCGTCW